MIRRLNTLLAGMRHLRDLLAVVALAAAALGGQAVEAQPTGETISGGNALEVGRVYRNGNGQFQFVFQPDGNLVVQRADGSFHWGLNLMPEVEFWRARRAELTKEGQLRLTDEAGNEVWSTKLQKYTGPATLGVTDNGRLAITIRSMWGAYDVYPGYPRADLPIAGGQKLKTNTEYFAQNGAYALRLQPDRNMVVVRMPEDRFVWGLNLLTEFDFRQGASVGMEPDGTLAVRDAAGKVLWSVPKQRAVPGSVLQLSDQGVLFIQRPDGSVAWSSDGSTPAPIGIAPAPADTAQAASQPQAQSGSDKSADTGGTLLGLGSTPLGSGTTAPAAQLARTDPLPPVITASFRPQDKKVLPGTLKDVDNRGGCERTRNVAPADRIGRLALVAQFYQNDCYPAGAYAAGDYEVEQGVVTTSDGNRLEAYRLHPPARKPGDFLASHHAVIYEFAEAGAHTVYALEDDALRKLGELPADKVTAGAFAKLPGVDASVLTRPITIVVAPSEKRLKATHKLGEGVEGAMIAKTPLGRWESYRYAVPGTPFDTATGFDHGPETHENVYGQTRRFFAVFAGGQPRILWQDETDGDVIYLTSIGADLRENVTIKLPNSPREKLAAATSDGQDAIFYLTIQRGGEKQNTPRGIHLYKVDTAGTVLKQATLNGGARKNDKSPKELMDISHFGEFVADMAYSGGKLGLMLARRLHRREDGLQHQSGSAFVFDAQTLAMEANLGQTSGHSFGNVLGVARDGAFLGIDLGDNYPRGVHLHRFDAKGLRSRVVYSFKARHAQSARSPDGRSYPVYREASSLGKTFYQWSNDNNTYTELGGVVETDRGITVIFAGEPDPSGRSLQNGRAQGYHNDPRNIGLVQVARDFHESSKPVLSRGVAETGGFYTFGGKWRELKNEGIVWLTRYADKARENASRIKAAPLPDGSILIVWETWTPKAYVSTWAMKVSDAGKVLAGPVELGPKVRLGRRGDPLVVDGRVLLVAGDGPNRELVVSVLTP